MQFESPGSKIVLYLVLTLALSSIFYALIIANGDVGGGGGGGGLYVLGLMWCPAIAALLTCRIAGVDYGILGWKWGETRWELAAFLIPLGYATVAYLIIWTTGLGGFGNKEFEVQLARSVWPAAVLHASHNLLIQSFYTPLTSARGKNTPYAIDEFGFVLPLVAVVVAIWFWQHRSGATTETA